MDKAEVVDGIKTKRAQIRKRVTKRIQNCIAGAAKGGHFPDFEEIVKGCMAEISDVMNDENLPLTILEWSIILQEKEPDRFCEKTMELLCLEK